jgi:cytochrome P450
LLGNTLQLSPQRVHQQVEAWAQQYGSLFRMHFGRSPVLVVADSRTINAILRERPDGYRRPDVTANVSEELGGNPGVFLAEGAEWRKQRTMVMQAFAPHAIKAYFPLIARVGARLQQRWLQQARDDQPIALDSDLKRYTVDIIAGLAFGHEVNTIDHGDDLIQQHLQVTLEGTSRRSLAPFPYWRYLRLPADRKLEHSVATVRQAVTGFIASARAQMAATPTLAEHPQNMLQAMLAAADREGSGITPETVIGNVSTMLLAGEDSTATALAWLILLLSRHPEALRRVQDEVLRVAPTADDLGIEQMDNLDYLDACIQESMRLKPPAPFVPLQAVRDTVIDDVRVPAGSYLWCVLRHDSVSDQLVRNAKSFDPQRWLDGEGPKNLSIPFGSGPRLCPGRYLSLLEIKVAMACLLSRFDIVSVAGDDSEHMSFFMAPGALRMRLREHR